MFVTVTAFDVTPIQYEDQYRDIHYNQDSLYTFSASLLLTLLRFALDTFCIDVMIKC